MKLKLYFITLLFFLALDSLWLGLLAPKFYRSQIGFLMAERPNFIAAGIFYLLFIAGMMFFVMEPEMKDSPISQAVLRGAFFGLITMAPMISQISPRLKAGLSCLQWSFDLGHDLVLFGDAGQCLGGEKAKEYLNGYSVGIHNSW